MGSNLENNRYRKRPVVIEARQWLPDNLEAAGRLVGWLLAAGVDFNHFGQGEGGATPLNIKTLEGTMRAEAGDWIIQGVKGEFYPCKPDIFAATYEPEYPLYSVSESGEVKRVE